MPFGCGEQNMLGFAPDVYIARYLDESGQLKAEIMAKLEKMMVTGYQRELTYRRSDGSFSAFGMQDEEGSLWLTAFVLKSFAQARSLIYVDQQVLDDASAWIKQYQQDNGSFEAVGFVHHQEMLGGMSGKDALTAYVTVALLEANELTAAGRAASYLEGKLSSIEDAYTLAITCYALELANSPAAGQAYQKLLALAKEGETGIYWGDEIGPSEPIQENAGFAPRMPYIQNRSASIETTAYAMLALIQRGDKFNAGRAGQWMVAQRNGFDSTQDTVVGLQALTSYAGSQKADVDLTVNVQAGGFIKDIRVTPDNFDVLQLVELPIDTNVTISSLGKGEVIGQVVTRFNITESDEAQPVIGISVKYDSTQVEVNDLVTVGVNLSFNPPEPVESGMLVVDISVPTGFAADIASIEAALAKQPLFKRYDISGRKVIFYIDNLKAGASLSFTFKVQALYPVRAKGVTSQAYSYYQPEFRGESLSEPISIN
jgi:CD109 antigen